MKMIFGPLSLPPLPTLAVFRFNWFTANVEAAAIEACHGMPLAVSPALLILLWLTTRQLLG
jgi:hypothetical protein